MDSAFTPELFFKEATLQVLIPNLSSTDDSSCSIEKLISTIQRPFAFYDEQLRVYLYISIPHRITGTGPEVLNAVQSFCSQLDVHLESTILDAGQQHQSPTLPRTTSKQQLQQQQNPSSLPSSPKLSKRESGRLVEAPVPFFSHTYSSRGKDPEPTVQERDGTYCFIYPLTIPIVYKDPIAQRRLSIYFSISYRPLPVVNLQKMSNNDESGEEDTEYDIDMFETVDLLGGLRNDPTFSADHERPVQRFLAESHVRQANAGLGIQTGHSNPQALSLRRYIRETLPLRSGLVVRTHTINASLTDKTVMLSVELENPLDADCKFIVESLDVHVSNAVIFTLLQSENTFPLSMNNLDQMVFLYNVTVLEDGSIKAPQQPQRVFKSRRPTAPAPLPVVNDRIQPQRISIQICSTPVIDGVPAAPMRSKRDDTLDVSGLIQRRDDGITDSRFSSPYPSPPPFLARSQASLMNSLPFPPGGHPVHYMPPSSIDGLFGNKRTSAQQFGPGARRAQEIETLDGIIVSFEVPEKIAVGKVFALHIFIVNRSKHTRRFQVMIPNRKRPTLEMNNDIGKTSLPNIPVEKQPIEPSIDETEFLQLYSENETREADIICLENNVRLSALGPDTSQSVDIKFVAVKEKLNTIDLVQLVDQDTGFVTNLRHVLEIFVEQSDS